MKEETMRLVIGEKGRVGLRRVGWWGGGRSEGKGKNKEK